MRKKAKAPITPSRAAVYVRVSSEEQIEGFSLDAQTRAARLHCEAQGWDIVEWYRDEGKSARGDDLNTRPAFKRMLQDAELGSFDVLVVHKLDRFSRNVKTTLATIERLEELGIKLVSITESLDLTNPIGKVMLTFMASLAQYFSDNLSSEVKKGKDERKKQGRHNGLLPFGVKKNTDGIPVPDPENYQGLLMAFELAANGKSDREVAEALTDAGFRTTGNRGRNAFTKDTVCRLLQNRFYLGELTDGNGGWVEGIHNPLLDDDLFERAQRSRGANSSGARKVTRAHRRHSLSGLAVCGHCGGRLHILTQRNGTARIYCYQRRQSNRCQQSSLLLEEVEQQISAYVATFRIPDELVEQVIALHKRAHQDRDDANQRRQRLQTQRDRLVTLFRLGDVDEKEFLQERTRIDVELAGLKETVDQASLYQQAAALLRDLPTAWGMATPEGRNDLARLVFESIEVTDDRVTSVVPQPYFAPFFVVNGTEKENADGPTDGGAVNVWIDQAEVTGVGLTYAPSDRASSWSPFPRLGVPWARPAGHRTRVVAASA